jgi:hypothetical protein
MRNYRGSDYNGGYPLTELTLQDFKHILNPTILAQMIQPDLPTLKFAGVNFNGNLGDFASARDSVEIVEYLVSHNVPVMINTNGSLRNSAWWARLALPKVTIGFAIDGLADTHHLYRQDTDWHRIIEHAQALIRAGGRAIWRFVPFEHNRHQEQECRKMAREMGFFGFDNIYDGRDRGPVFTRDGEFTHYIGPTPPGTGVIALAISLTASKSTSPQRTSSTRLMPTSITTAPGFTKLASTIRGRPTAAIRTSARAHVPARSFVRE